MLGSGEETYGGGLWIEPRGVEASRTWKACEGAIAGSDLLKVGKEAVDLVRFLARNF